MTIIVNEIEVIAPPPGREEIFNAVPGNLSPAGPTPRDIYWVKRKLIERHLRSQAR